LIKSFSFILGLFIFFSTSLFSEYSENKIPKPKINKFDTLKISDLTGRVQINTSLGGSIWVWENEEDSRLGFNIEDISIGVDKYFWFYNGVTGNLFHKFSDSLTSLSLGYKLNLYEFIYTKLEIETVVYPYFDLGLSISLGIEFSLFNLLRVFAYNDITTFLINGRNKTTIYLNYYLGLGFYF